MVVAGTRLTFRPLRKIFGNSCSHAPGSLRGAAWQNKTSIQMLEIIRKAPAAHTKVVLFDFDGTLSLIRTGWMGVMVPMMVEILADLRTGETEEELRVIVEDYVWRLTG